MPGQDAIRRRLGRELANMRVRKGASGRRLAADLGWNQSKISRTESGATLPPLGDVERWLTYCAADPQETRRVMALAKAAAAGTSALPDVDTLTAMIYETTMVPAILQTTDYARNVLLTTGAATPRTAAEAVAARIQRQGTVSDGTQRVHALLTETALTWQPGPADVLLDQLDRLRTLARRPNVRIGIIAAAQQRLAPASASFTITQWPDGGSDVVTETPAGDRVITRQSDIVRYHEMFQLQRDHAVYNDQAFDLLTRIADSLK